MTRMQLVAERSAEYGRRIRVATLASLGLVISAFLLIPNVEVPGRGFAVRPDRIVIVPTDELVQVPPNQPKVQPIQRKIPVPDENGVATDSGLISNPGPGFDTAVAAASIEPTPFWKVEKKPVVLDIPKPEYPEIARAAGIVGRVTVLIVVGVTGAVDRAEVQKSSGSAVLDQAAVAAALRARFEPGRQLDRPVPVQMSIPYEFKLN